MPPVALTIAGSDPSGGAGIQADLKTFHQFGVYGEAAITLLTVQNTESVSRIESVSAQLVIEQIEAVVRDIPPAAAKIGALGTAEVVEAVSHVAMNASFPLVLDPVMISKHGARLLSAAGEQILVRKLLPRALLVTPNIPEAEALTGFTIDSSDAMLEAARRILALGCPNVLIKGGHASGPANDLLVSRDLTITLPGTRIQTRHTHGTGCTYSAAITASLALRLALPDAVRRAKAFIQQAIETAPGLGCGQGPVNHFANPSESGTS